MMGTVSRRWSLCWAALACCVHTAAAASTPPQPLVLAVSVSPFSRNFTAEPSSMSAGSR
jgi:hypothetical protein